MSASRRRWLIVFLAVAAAYAVLTVLIAVGSPLNSLDGFLANRHLVPTSSSLRSPLLTFEYLAGEGVPVSTVAALYAIWRASKTRTWKPVTMFFWALLLLNCSIGGMKHAIGRLGPRLTSDVHTLLAGGTIYPSGHTANAVVMYGLIAMIVPVALRRRAIVFAVLMSVTVGLGTVALDTHWISDVLGGWLGGALVLLLLPGLTRPTDRWVLRAAGRIRVTLTDWAAEIPVLLEQMTGSRAPGATRPAPESARYLTDVGPAPAPEPAPAPTARQAAAMLTAIRAGPRSDRRARDRPAVTAGR